MQSYTVQNTSNEGASKNKTDGQNSTNSIGLLSAAKSNVSGVVIVDDDQVEDDSQ